MQLMVPRFFEFSSKIGKWGRLYTALVELVSFLMVEYWTTAHKGIYGVNFLNGQSI